MILQLSFLLIGLSANLGQEWTYDVRFTLNSRNQRPELTGSVVDNKVYVFEELHIHWSDNNLEGSEHSINDYFSSAEIHFVHFNQRYDSLSKARDQRDGLVVLTVLVQLSRVDNKAIEPLIRVLPQVSRYNSSAIVKNALILEKLLPINKEIFFTYKGSLTTPPCSETVKFIIYADPIRISPFQLSQFRRLHERPLNGRSLKIFSNTRDIHRKNSRIVEVSDVRFGDTSSGSDVDDFGGNNDIDY
ncbi:carbonic anhydrase 6-like [Oppia nitens]|uniref:carbonic anhydrase 6-like n=1 Tax=Oppia nitens TaxID=1686743 RepID=UPI0023DB24BE|nr:carbonic anhydrase 6-like [Oppia nitens]